MNELAERKKDIINLCFEMSPEQLNDYFNAALEINLFAEEMKYRFAEKVLEGRIGWQDNDKSIIDEIDARLTRLAKGEDSVLIGIANWAFIGWYGDKKEKILDEAIEKEDKDLIYSIMKDLPANKPVWWNDPNNGVTSGYSYYQGIIDGMAILSEFEDCTGVITKVSFKEIDFNV